MWITRTCMPVCLAATSLIWLCNPKDCRLSGSSVNGILQGRILEWVVIPFSRGSSQSSDGIQVSSIAGRFFANWATREAQPKYKIAIKSHLPVTAPCVQLYTYICQLQLIQYKDIFVHMMIKHSLLCFNFSLYYVL